MNKKPNQQILFKNKNRGRAIINTHIDTQYVPEHERLGVEPIVRDENMRRPQQHVNDDRNTVGVSKTWENTEWHNDLPDRKIGLPRQPFAHVGAKEDVSWSDIYDNKTKAKANDEVFDYDDVKLPENNLEEDEYDKTLSDIDVGNYVILSGSVVVFDSLSKDKIQDVLLEILQRDVNFFNTLVVVKKINIKAGVFLADE